jgi:hypothetical protein
MPQADGVLNMNDAPASSPNSRSPPTEDVQHILSHLLVQVSRTAQEVGVHTPSARHQLPLPDIPTGGTFDNTQMYHLRPATICGDPEAQVLQMTPQSSVPLASTPEFLPQHSAACTHLLQLAHTSIKYSAADIPDPPVLSFVRDLARLDRLWRSVMSCQTTYEKSMKNLLWSGTK